MTGDSVSKPQPTLVAPADGWRELPSRGRRCERIVGTLMALPTGIGLGIALAAIMQRAWEIGFAGGATIALLVTAAILATSWWWIGVRHAHVHYRLDADGWRLRRGVFWRSETLVPRSRVQHVDVARGPMDRRFDLATLKVYTAGTRHASVALEGLDAAEALTLRNALVDRHDDAI